MTCDLAKDLSGGCSLCGAHDAPLHLIEGGPKLQLVCKACCPVHRTAPAVEWLQPEPVTITGTQEALF